MDTLELTLEYIIARKVKDVREELKSSYLNDLTCRIAQSQSKAFKDVKTYSEIISELKEDKVVDNRTEEQIIEDVLNDFKKQTEKEGE